ncbi:hypothetical protein ACLK1T_20355 [Escherichia coli]
MANELTWHDVLAEESSNPIFLIPSTPSPASSDPASLSTHHKKMSLTRCSSTELGDVESRDSQGQDPYHGPGQAHGLAFRSPRNRHSSVTAEYV